MATLVQRSFSGGELAPSLYARVDTAKYANGARTIRNMLVMRHGGVQNRPGTKFVCEAQTSSESIRLIPFVFNNDQTYVLEFGDQYMRVIKDGSLLTTNTQNITGISKANPGVVTYSGADSYSNGDTVYIAAVGGMTEVNGRWFKVANVDTGANTFELTDNAGSNVDTTGYTTYTSGGTVSLVYEIATPYLEADLDEIRYVQSADVITLTHPSYEPRELSRSGDTTWSISTISFEPEISAPVNITISGGGSGSSATRYLVTAVDLDTGEESIAGTGSTGSITAITNSNSACTVTSTAHGLATGQIIDITDVGGMTEVNGNRYLVAYDTANTFVLRDLAGNNIDSSGFGTYTSGGTWTEYGVTVTGHATLSPSNRVTLEWDEVSGADEYNVYKEVNAPSGGGSSTSVYGFTGISKTNTFTDIGIDADGSDNPTQPNNPFEGSGNYPATVTYVQQRRGFGNTTNDPERVWFSRIGNFKNFTRRSPIQEDDAFNFVLAGRQVNSIQHLIDVGQLLIFTSGGEWAIQGDAAGTITPLEVNPKQYGYNGAGSLPPLVLGGNALYVQARGSIVRDLAFEDAVQGYRGRDLTIFSAHLFDGFTLNDWAYQQIPHSNVWIARSDGTLLGLTYVREHEMWAWHRHDFQGGVVENVCSIPEGDEDGLYLVIKRTIDGKTTRYIERFSSRFVDDTAIEDSIFMDSTLTYDGTHTGNTTMTVSGGTNWTYDESLTLTASAGTFDSSYVGNQIHLTGSDGTLIRFTIDAYSSTTVVTGRPNKTIPAGMRSTAVSTWGYAVSEVDGLWHLEGEDVSVFADGFVVASPNNDSYDTVTITNGVATLDKSYVKIHVGLPYISDVETLDIDTPQGETLADKKKHVSKLNVFVEDSRGIWAGPKPPTSDTTDPLENLRELKIRDDEGYDEPVDLATGVVELVLKSEWNSNGRVFIRQVDPVPLAVLAVAPSGLFGFRGT